MAVSLSTASNLSQNQLQRGVVEAFQRNSVVLDRIPFITVVGNAYAYNTESALPSVAFRDVNAAYTESAGTVSQSTERLYILGGDVDVDRFIVQTRSNINNQRAIQTEMKVKALVAEFQNTFINGDNDSDSTQFDGLKERITGSQVISPDDTSAGLKIVGSSDSDRHAFLDKLDELCAAVQGGPDVLYMNRQVLTKIQQAARHLQYWERDRDEFGRVVTFYNGIPLLDIGNDSSGNPIIPQEEEFGDDGGGSPATDEASSIYAVKWARAEGDTGVAGLTNGGVQVYDLGEVDSKPVFRTRIEFYVGLASFGVAGAARLEGVLAE